ncbi:MAG: hypothetical protein OXU19_17210 [bacterium]|nr:hypothetical protein [bacterium]
MVTHRRPFDPPRNSAEAGEPLARSLLTENASALTPTPGFAGRLSEAVLEAGATGNAVFDARIVAPCRACGVSALLTKEFRGASTIHNPAAGEAVTASPR